MEAGQKRLVLLACILGTAVVTLDAMVVNVALPAIAADLGGGLAGQQWTSNAYLLTLGSVLLVGGALGDVLGERRVFAVSVGAFGVSSLACAAAPTIGVLVAARALQGIAGAVLTPVALATIVAVFDDDERGRAVGAWTAWSGIGLVLGPLLGGQIVDAASWRWIFAINMPIVIVTLMLVLRSVPRRPGRGGLGQMDWTGGALCALGLAGVSFGLIEQPLHGFGAARVWVPLAAGAALFAAFLAFEARARAPMLPLELFRRRNFAAGNVETFAVYGGLGLVYFLLLLFLQQAAGWSALAAGTTSLPPSIVMLLLSTRFGALADRHGPRLFMCAGPLIAAAGLALLVPLDAEVDFATDLLPGLLVFSLGLAITVAPLTATVLADADADTAGIASGVNNAIARVAALVAIAAVGVVVAERFGAALDDELGPLARRPELARPLAEARREPLARVDAAGLPADARGRVELASRDAAVSAYRVGMGISAGLVALGGVLGIVGIRNPRRTVRCEECPGGQLVGAPADAARPPRALAARE